LTADILAHAKELLVIGCFCIGTNQVDLDYAAERGIAVFNSPFSNSRSVAEMTISNIIALARQLGDRNNELHRGLWNKTSNGCHEIRGKKLGIVGYGHIGSQLSVLAEALGMNVFFFDILQIMPLGCATPMETLEDLLKEVDFVTLHVPATPDTKDMIGAAEIALMKKGSYLINASRGNVVVIPELAKALRTGHLAGAAIDVYPKEPHSNGEGFESELIGCPNTILSPHIGGSTEEAQNAIGVEVSTSLTKYVNTGSTLAAVNFPETDLRAVPAASTIIRVCNVHHNVPGVLKVNLSNLDTCVMVCSKSI
jgi:D-3-phosphoglycerate dehydrogenase